MTAVALLVAGAGVAVISGRGADTSVIPSADTAAGRLPSLSDLPISSGQGPDTHQTHQPPASPDPIQAMPSPSTVTASPPPTCGHCLGPPAHPVVPVISGLLPPTGPVLGGAMLTIRGTGFTPDAEVFFDSLQVERVTRVSSTELSVVTPPAQQVAVRSALDGLHGLSVAVTVRTAGGTSTSGLAGRYTYL
jgi:hypothetical protein